MATNKHSNETSLSTNEIKTIAEGTIHSPHVSDELLFEAARNLQLTFNPNGYTPPDVRIKIVTEAERLKKVQMNENFPNLTEDTNRAPTPSARNTTENVPKKFNGNLLKSNKKLQLLANGFFG